MKGFYLYYRDVEDQGTCVGIDRKVADQIAAFNQAGLNCKFRYCSQPTKTFDMVKACLPGFSDGVHWPKIDDMKEADYVYIRRPRFISKDFVTFLKKLKEDNPEVKLILEVPTFPYDAELMTPKRYAALLKDRLNRKQLSLLLDRIADLSGNDEIFGVPTIQFVNGINLERVKKRAALNGASDDINIMCAACFSKWHGVDRFIRGLADYYESGGNRNIVLHLAGDGDDVEHLKNLVRTNNLGQHVQFLGNLNQEELNELYNQCTIAVASLGLHRIGISLASTLKTREYLAKGIPFVYSGEIDVFGGRPFEYCLQVPADESIINIDELLAFQDALYSRKSEQDVIDDMREYAEKTVGVDVAMEEVIKYISS